MGKRDIFTIFPWELLIEKEKKKKKAKRTVFLGLASLLHPT
jgi:hypothetical protein